MEAGAMEPASTTLIFVRHGESKVTVRRVVGGERTCDGLSPLGRRQAEALRDRIEQEKLGADVLIASTLPRAYETAALLAPALGDLPVELDADLVEHRPGEADGVRFDEFADLFELFDLRREPDRPLAPGAESLREFYERVRRALERIEGHHRGRTVMIVCHGGVVDNAVRCLLGVGLEAPFDLWTLNASLTEFAGSFDRWTLRRYNDASHLLGLPERTLD
jgi:2,3-bisphosphoglycerate-dependent phosphoglycerate mutase